MVQKITMISLVLNSLVLFVVILLMFFPLVTTLLGYTGFNFGIDDLRYLNIKWTFFSKLPYFLFLALIEVTLLLNLRAINNFT